MPSLPGYDDTNVSIFDTYTLVSKNRGSSHEKR